MLDLILISLVCQDKCIIRNNVPEVPPKFLNLVIPSKKALQHIKTEIKNLTCRKNLPLPKEVVLNKINGVVRGWVNYFYYGNCSNDLLRLKGYLDERVRTYLRRKHCIKNRG